MHNKTSHPLEHQKSCFGCFSSPIQNMQISMGTATNVNLGKTLVSSYLKQCLGMNEIFSADSELHVKSFGGAFSTQFYSLFYLSIRHFPSSENQQLKAL